jgi:uncharacterized damage-inducible protein DinB
MSGNVPALDIARYWAPLNEQLIDLVELIPDEQMDFSPKPGLHNFRGVLIHIAMSRHGWMGGTGDGEASPDVLRAGQTRDGLKEQLRTSWARVERFLSDDARLTRTYKGDEYNDRQTFDGHWIAYHLLEHDIHHRADIFHYLAALGIQHGEIQAP